MISFGCTALAWGMVMMTALLYESCEHDASSVELFAKEKIDIMIPVSKVLLVPFSQINCSTSCSVRSSSSPVQVPHCVVMYCTVLTISLSISSGGVPGRVLDAYMVFSDVYNLLLWRVNFLSSLIDLTMDQRTKLRYSVVQ